MLMLNYAINPSMVGHWDVLVYLYSLLIIEIFLFGGTFLFSKQVWARVHVTNQSIVCTLFRRKTKSVHWADISSIKVENHFPFMILFLVEESENPIFQIHVNRKDLLVLFQLCPIQTLKEDLKKAFDPELNQ